MVIIMQKKKGFTLVELLAVIIIISITSMIIFPNITRVINDSKIDLYDAKIILKISLGILGLNENVNSICKLKFHTED